MWIVLGGMMFAKRRAGRGRHGHQATDAHTLFNSEGEPLGADFFYTSLEGVGNGPRDIRVLLATLGDSAKKISG
jgi:hypothetical protein